MLQGGNEMKERYAEPKAEMMYLSVTDILTASPGGGLVDDSGEDFKGGDIIIIQ